MCMWAELTELSRRPQFQQYCTELSATAMTSGNLHRAAASQGCLLRNPSLFTSHCWVPKAGAGSPPGSGASCCGIWQLIGSSARHWEAAWTAWICQLLTSRREAL